MSSSSIAPCDDFEVYARAENWVNPRILLHGDLELEISEGRALDNLSTFNRVLNFFSHGDQERKHHVKRRPINAYVTVSVPEATVARTLVIEDAINPQWGEKFFIFLCHPVENLVFKLKVVQKPYRAKVKGEVKISAQRIATGELISEYFPLIRENGRQYRDSALKIEIKFTPFDQNPLYGQSIPNDPGHAGVRHTYFPLRKGCELRLYQDAHVPNRILPEIELEDGRVFRQHNCFEDICFAIAEAERLIYIAGWSVFCKIRLVREPSRPLPQGGNLTLGQLLKYKSEEGVRVLLLIWEDQSGLMQTHDEETRRFFEGSSVTCVLTPRCASKKLCPLKQYVLRTMFTNHQKCILVDTQAAGNCRKITAFLGGFDLSDGRYDTPEHRLLRDLDTVFKDDFLNRTIPSEIRAPRQPWHDLHCRIDGAAAYDVLLSFEQHWRQSADNDGALIRIERTSQMLSPSLSVSPDGTTVVPVDDSKVRVSDEDDPESWHAQIVRSTDSGAAKGLPVYVEEAYEQNLVCSKGLVIDKSIQIAYIQAIRSAQHYIYIENQYFIGSSYAWPSYKCAGADNLIPIELALKIANKIQANERFAVYVIIPMYPEGDPESETVQEILFWQYQTMQMMYTIIAKELQDMNRLDSHPLDYLNFYCLGKRESNHEENLAINGDKVSDSQRFQRFMIYVHSKAMIVDDEYVIIGSANINERSMAGTRDIEIATSAYQPHYTRARKKEQPRGQVYGYRNSLWAEHLGTVNSHFRVPESRECIRMVNEIAAINWKKFTAADFTPMQGHLLKYPIHVDENGKVGPLRGYEIFPDVGGRVLGTKSHKFPSILTT